MFQVLLKIVREIMTFLKRSVSDFNVERESCQVKSMSNTEQVLFCNTFGLSFLSLGLPEQKFSCAKWCMQVKVHGQ